MRAFQSTVLLNSLALVCLTLSVRTSLGQTSQQSGGAKDPPVVDIVRMKNGDVLRGLVVKPMADGSGWLMLAEREWLQSAQPRIFAEAAAAEIDEARLANQQLIDRIDAELGPENGPPIDNDKSLSPEVIDFLQFERDRCIARLDELGQTSGAKSEKFIWLTIPRKDFGNVRAATPESRKLAVWAWWESIANVSTKKQSEIIDELKAADAPYETSPPNMTEDILARTESDANWQIRKAITEHIFGESILIDGTSGRFAVRGSDSQEILRNLIGGGGGGLLGNNLLGGLSGGLGGGDIQSQIDEFMRPARGNRASASNTKRDNAWYAAAIPIADQLLVKPTQHQRLGTSFVATDVVLDPTATTAVVRIAFLVSVDDQWQLVWTDSASQRSADVAIEQVETLKNDPRIGSALSIVESLGGGMEQRLETALRFGAATDAAQKMANAAFNRFIERYAARLSGPPLP